MTKMENRYAVLRTRMAEMGLDAIYINSAENYLYLSEFDNPDGWMVVTKERAYLFADFRYIEAAKAEATKMCEVYLPGAVTLQQIVRDNDVKNLGYEDRRLTCASLASIRRTLDGMGVEFCPVGGLFTDLRSFKTEDEIENIGKAQRIAEGAFHHILKVIHYDMTEMDVAAELEYYMKKNGSDQPSFYTIAVSGTASSRPHGVPRRIKLEKGFLTMDYGALIGGYHSDMTRTLVIGKADAEQKRLYETVLKAQEAVLDVIKEGERNADMDKIARDIIDGAGYEGCFGHGLGHGVGLEIHEQPNLSSRSDGTLQAGQLVTVEPGIYLEGKYGCRIEDMVFITPGGMRNLTDCPKEMIEI